MFDRREFISFLQEEFPEGQIVSGGKEFVCRCRFCGDSATNPYKMRFYISLNDPSGLILYNCFNCGVGGVLTSKILKQITSAPNSILLQLSTLNKTTHNGIRYIQKQSIYKIKYENIIDDKISRAKLNYINKRLGTNLTLQEVINNKIVLNLSSLIHNNNLEYTRSENIIEELSLFFIGGLSLNNAMVNMRNLSQEHSFIKNKHVKYILIPNHDDKKYYTIPSTCNLNNRIRINIAEGMFDILSVFYNLRHENRLDELYIAAGSKAYSSVIKMVLMEYGLLNCEFHIYADNDVEDKIFNNIKKICLSLQTTVIIHNNQYPNEKDYGVPLSHIKDSQYVLVRGL